MHRSPPDGDSPRAAAPRRRGAPGRSATTPGRRPLARRDVLRAVVVLAGAGTVAGCGEDAAPAASTKNPFPQSVASGDPRPASVVLWTRVEVAGEESLDQTLELVVAKDEALAERVVLGAGTTTLTLVALAAWGGAVKVRVEGLEPGTTYFYRFSLVQGAARTPSRTGRTRTAPAPEADAEVSFAVVSCQDFGGKWYHVYRHLAEQPLDFVLHLGDYIYETIGDPSFQAVTPERRLAFTDPSSAITLGDDGFLAARTLDNYRDLYRAYRSDPDLQRVHELFAMVAIPDDHEFSNDCHGATATYTDGREDETDFERRRAADRAWFEFMPVDYGEPPATALDEDAEFPDDFRVYRSFVFGQHLELVLSDLRRYRPDHVVPEDAFPGAVFMTAADARDVLGAVPDDAVAYVDVDGDEFASLRQTLVAVAPEQGFEATAIAGLLSVPWLDGVLAAAGADGALDPDDPAFERGYAYHQLLKSEEFSSQGSRYLLAERPFRALAAQRFAETDGASERLMGEEQRAWFTSTLAASTRTWKVWGNEYTLMRRAIDFTPVTLVPPEFQQRLLLTAEDWDGAPNERNALLRELADVENVVVMTGDLHAFFAGTPYAEDAPETAVVELVAGSVSSTTWLSGIKALIAATPSLPPALALAAELVGSALTDRDTQPNPHLAWLDLESNGYAVVTARSEELRATAYRIADTLVATPPEELPLPLDAAFQATEFRVASGSRTLEQRIDGTFERWDAKRFGWV